MNHNKKTTSEWTLQWVVTEWGEYVKKEKKICSLRVTGNFPMSPLLRHLHIILEKNARYIWLCALRGIIMI